MNTRARIVALVAAALVLVGLVLYAGTIGILTGAVQPGPRASGALPTPTPTPEVAASPSPTAVVAADRYGYVLTSTSTDQQRIIVRRERDDASVFELAGGSPAVSIDGKHLAYWRTTANVGPTDLRVFDLADPTTDRTVFTLTGQTLGGTVVWSNDGQGLLVATYRPGSARPGDPPRPAARPSTTS